MMIHVTNFKLLDNDIKKELRLPITEQHKYLNYVYIGRRNKSHSLSPSSLENEFVVGKDYSISQSLKEYRDLLLFDLESFQGMLKTGLSDRNVICNYPRIYELKRIKKLHEIFDDIYLVCWCKKVMDDDIPCHGDVIKEILEDK